MAKSLEELDVYNKSMDLTVHVYRASQDFPKAEIYGLTSQLRRAAISVSANISEGWARRSAGEMKQFLRIALGSRSELATLIDLSHRLGYLNDQIESELGTMATEVGKCFTHLKGVSLTLM